MHMDIGELSSYEEVFFEQQKHQNCMETQYKSGLTTSLYSRFNCNKNLEIWRILQSLMGPSSAAKNLTVSIHEILMRESQSYNFNDCFEMLKAAEIACEDALNRINLSAFMITCLNSEIPIFFDRFSIVIEKYSSRKNAKIYVHKMNKEALIESSLAGMALDLISYFDFFVGASDTIEVHPVYIVNTLKQKNEDQSIREILIKISSTRNILKYILQKVEPQKVRDLNKFAHLFDLEEYVSKIRHYKCDIRMFKGDDCFLFYIFTDS